MADGQQKLYTGIAVPPVMPYMPKEPGFVYRAPEQYPWGWMGPGGTIAGIFTKFLEGVAQGKALKFYQAEQERLKHWYGLQSLMAQVAESPIRPETKQELLSKVSRAMAKLFLDQTETKGKAAEKRGGLGGILRSIAQALGPEPSKVPPAEELASLYYEVQRELANPDVTIAAELTKLHASLLRDINELQQRIGGTPFAEDVMDIIARYEPAFARLGATVPSSILNLARRLPSRAQTMLQVASTAPGALTGLTLPGVQEQVTQPQPEAAPAPAPEQPRAPEAAPAIPPPTAPPPSVQRVPREVSEATPSQVTEPENRIVNEASTETAIRVQPSEADAAQAQQLTQSISSQYGIPVQPLSIEAVARLVSAAKTLQNAQPTMVIVRDPRDPMNFDIVTALRVGADYYYVQPDGAVRKLNPAYVLRYDRSLLPKSIDAVYEKGGRRYTGTVVQAFGRYYDTNGDEVTLVQELGRRQVRVLIDDQNRPVLVHLPRTPGDQVIVQPLHGITVRAPATTQLADQLWLQTAQQEFRNAQTDFFNRYRLYSQLGMKPEESERASEDLRVSADRAMRAAIDIMQRGYRVYIPNELLRYASSEMRELYRNVSSRPLIHLPSVAPPAPPAQVVPQQPPAVPAPAAPTAPAPAPQTPEPEREEPEARRRAPRKSFLQMALEWANQAVDRYMSGKPTPPPPPAPTEAPEAVQWPEIPETEPPPTNIEAIRRELRRLATGTPSDEEIRRELRRLAGTDVSQEELYNELKALVERSRAQKAQQNR